jgi:hypothetical protein
MTNLLIETIECLTEHNKGVFDVEWIGNKTKYCIDWHDFILLANFEYNSGYGGAEIPSDLIVVGKDFYMTRGEYDGSEWWDYHTQPVKPENSIKCTKLKGDGLWGDLERFQ